MNSSQEPSLRRSSPGLERAVHALAGEMLPEGTRFAIAQEEPPVVQAARSEMVHPGVDYRDRTDPATADRSKGNHPRFALCLALRDVVIGELPPQQHDRRRLPFRHQDEGILVHVATGQRDL